MIYYLDTSIWLDFHEKRGQNGECARKLILTIIEQGTIILYSDLHVRELKQLGYSSDEIALLFKIVRPNGLRHVHLYRTQNEEARALSSKRKIPLGDAIHAVLARDNNAVLVSRDHDFEKLKDITKTCVPEELY
ncbi:type II toxin-antitoxin system VapC family toxin [Candidatus Woesearchaeota archaeon]|nr:type II toxin-antitoxin system VapC family toxin [Candidatus Woesearchaeota archaeon]